MANRPIPIIAVGGIEHPAGRSVDFKDDVKATFGKPIRRIGPFIQLALLGAAKMVEDSTLPPHTNIYFTSGSGDMDVTIEVLQRTIRDRQSPKPLSFINTVSNAACYYLTKQFGIAGASSFISTRNFALESALMQAQQDIECSHVNTTLVGGVDILTGPEDTHRTRLGLSSDAAIGMGSHWFRLADSVDPKTTAIGHLIDVRIAKGWTSLKSKLNQVLTTACNLKLAFGSRLSEEMKAAVTAWLKADIYADFKPENLHYETAIGATLIKYLNDATMSGTTLLHIQQDLHGNLCGVLLSKD